MSGWHIEEADDGEGNAASLLGWGETFIGMSDPGNAAEAAALRTLVTDAERGQFFAELAQRAYDWRVAKYPETASKSWIMAKATEELGETARALVGLAEHREGRGDVTQEAAQTIIVLFSLIAAVKPDESIVDAIQVECASLWGAAAVGVEADPPAAAGSLSEGPQPSQETTG